MMLSIKNINPINVMFSINQLTRDIRLQQSIHVHKAFEDDQRAEVLSYLKVKMKHHYNTL